MVGLGSRQAGNHRQDVKHDFEFQRHEIVLQRLETQRLDAAYCLGSGIQSNGGKSIVRSRHDQCTVAASDIHPDRPSVVDAAP